MNPQQRVSCLLVICCIFDLSLYTASESCPDIPLDARFDCHPDDGPTQENCEHRGCFWCPTDDPEIPTCIYNSTAWPPTPDDEQHRVDCYPEVGSNQQKCQSRGCIYQPTSNPGVPWCYLPLNYGYKLQGDPRHITGGYSFNLTRINYISLYGGDSNVVYMDVVFYTEKELRIKIHDGTPRYEVPMNMFNGTDSYEYRGHTDRLYHFTYKNEPFFSFQIIRRETGAVLFDTSVGGFTFSDQYLQIGTLLPSKNVYGFGENEQSTFKNNLNWKTWGFFNRDQPPEGDINMYGIHPHYTVLENDGNAHSVLILNSNAQEVTFMPTPALLYRTIGGILDLYFFLGPTPEETVQQYTNLVGRYPLPPYWSLGFQLSRWGYNSIENMKEVDKRNWEAGIPQDVQVADIDLMLRGLDFTYDTINFAGFPEYLKELHSRGIKFIPIVDPGISTGEKNGTYFPYDLGQQMDVWVKRPDGTPARGIVWPEAPVNFPDFTNPKTHEWWATCLKNFKSEIDWDGIWIDMNEPTNEVTGDYDYGCAKNKLNYPPYRPKIGGSVMADQTLCMDHVHYENRPHYNVHGIYGWSQSAATHNGILKARGGKRAFVLSRSTFPGSGRWAAHWLGDNYSSWPNLRHSIIGIMQFNHHGIPMVGADICGFQLDCNEELCQRWMQLGSFYPFSRNHNTLGAKDQDPAVWGEKVANSSREALMIRYTLLPYLYTLFYNHRTQGSTVFRALWHEFPRDVKTWDVDHQFMWGSGFLVSPVVVQGAVSVSAYFPRGVWYSYYDGDKVESRGQTMTLSAPTNYIPLHVRGGHILPMQEPDINTMHSRKRPLGLIVALDEGGSAYGTLYYDDGDSSGTLESSQYYLAEFYATRDPGSLEMHIMNNNYSKMKNLLFGTVRVFGTNDIQSVKINGQKHGDFKYNKMELVINNINVASTGQLLIDWS